MGTSGISGAYMSLGHPHARCISLEVLPKLLVLRNKQQYSAIAHIDIRMDNSKLYRKP